MLRQVRETVTQALWQSYRASSSQVQAIEANLKSKGINRFVLDHFAIIDLPGLNTGIDKLRQVFSSLGYVERGRGYLADKQNDFVWMAEVDCENKPVEEVLPQVVIADFRPQELPVEVKTIIEKYAALAPTFELSTLQSPEAIIHYLQRRDWPLPTIKEFKTVHEFNELLAWVLVFGRKPNHFTFAIHLLPQFSNLEQFNIFIENELHIPLNRNGGLIKGNRENGIEQSSTVGSEIQVELADDVILLPDSFIEFVWRYPKKDHAVYWGDYFTGFVPEQANHVIESLYTE